MNTSINTPEWFQYIETPVRSSGPVKLDYILAQRMREFMRAKHHQYFDK